MTYQREDCGCQTDHIRPLASYRCTVKLSRYYVPRHALCLPQALLELSIERGHLRISGTPLKQLMHPRIDDVYGRLGLTAIMCACR